MTDEKHHPSLETIRQEENILFLILLKVLFLFFNLSLVLWRVKSPEELFTEMES